MYAITGATGHIGHRIAELLLEHGEQVRVIGRTAEKLQPWVSKGTEAFPGTFEDRHFLVRAFRGAEGVFAMIGLSPDIVRLFIEMYHGCNEGTILRGIVRTPQNTTETAFEDFATEFAKLMKKPTRGVAPGRTPIRFLATANQGSTDCEISRRR